MRHYKLWIEIEEFNDEAEEYRQVTQTGEAEPVPMGTFDTLEEAVEAAESYEYCEAQP